MSPKLAKYRKSVGQKVGGGGQRLLDRFAVPLLYEPGESWGYSSAIDWAGRLVERLTNKSLEEYMRENIWTPLGIIDMTFFPSSRPDLAARMSGMTVRDPSGSGHVVYYGGPSINHNSREYLGGQGCYGTMPDYLKILHSLLVDDEKLLLRKSTAEFFSPQLSAPAKQFLNGLQDRPEVWGMFVGEFPRHISRDWGLGGILTVEHDAGWRRKGTMIWSGLPNLFWVRSRPYRCQRDNQLTIR